MSKLQAIGPDAVKEATADALQLVMGRGRRWSVDQMAQATACSASALKQYAAANMEMSVSTWLRLCAVLGAPFANAVATIAGFEMTPVEPADANPYGLIADATALCAGLGEALRDGKIDHREWAALRPQLEQAYATLGALLRRAPGAAGASPGTPDGATPISLKR